MEATGQWLPPGPGTYALSVRAIATDGAPTVDLENRPRDARPDIGAYEYWQASSWLYLPLVGRLATTKGTKES